MKDDTKDILEELEKELLAVQEEEEITEEDLMQEVLPEEDLLNDILLEKFLSEEDAPEEIPLEEALSEDALLEGILSEQALQEPAFEDPDFIAEAEESDMYRNFSNGYGQDLPEEEKKNTMSRGDKINTGLMIANSALCLGIIGLLIYWLVRFL